MRRLFLILLVALVATTSLFALYVVLDLDPDDTSPLVAAPSYDALFEAAVRQRTGKTYASLDEARRLKVLRDIVGSREMAAIREVALFRSRSLANRSAAFDLLKRHLPTLPEDLYEVAAASIAALQLPTARAYLDSMYLVLDREPAAHTPLGGYRASTLVASEESSGIAVAFNERTRDSADYSVGDATEIALLFPAGPEYVVAVPNADDVLDRFDASRFSRSLDNSPVPDDAWALPLLRTVHSLRRRLSENLGFVGTFFSPEQLLRDNLLVGRYGEQYLLASFKDKNVGIAETLLSVFETLGGDFGIRRWKVGELAAAAIVNRSSGRALSYATVGDYLVVATDTALMTRSLRTYQYDRARSIAIDPIFNASYRRVDPSGTRDVLFAWFNPSRYFDVTGSEQPAAYRRTVLARATGRTLAAPVAATVAERMRAMPGVVAAIDATTDSASHLWRYIVNVRSLGRSHVDSLARLSGVDIAQHITPFVGRTWSFGYGGVEHLRREYGFSNTAFNVVTAVPLENPPAAFASSLSRLFSSVTSLVYTEDTLTAATTRMWIASDTATHDSSVRAFRMQPSYAMVDNRILLVATTPSLLRAAATHFTSHPGAGTDRSGYARGIVRLDSLANNSSRYLRSYLLRSDRYSPAEVARRIEPLRRAVAQYGTLWWTFSEDTGLRSGIAGIGI